MPHETHREANGIRWVFFGIVTDDELLRCNVESYEDPNFKNSRYQIVDFLRVEKFQVSPNTIRRVAEMDARAAKRNPSIRVAIVATTLLIRGYARMYELSGVGNAWEVQIFEKVYEARAWLGDIAEILDRDDADEEE